MEESSFSWHMKTSMEFFHKLSWLYFIKKYMLVHCSSFAWEELETFCWYALLITVLIFICIHFSSLFKSKVFVSTFYTAYIHMYMFVDIDHLFAINIKGLRY